MRLNMSLITITDELFYSVDNSFVPVHASRLLRCFFLQTFLIFFMLSKITPKENNLRGQNVHLRPHIYLITVRLLVHRPSETCSLKNFKLMERPALLALLNRVSAAGLCPLDDFNQLRLNNSEKRSAARVPTPARLHQSPTIVVEVR